MDSDYQILQNNPVSDLRKALTHYNSETKIIGISKLKKEALVSTIKNRFKPPKISTQNGDIMLDARDMAIDTYRLKPKKKKEKKVSKPKSKPKSNPKVKKLLDTYNKLDKLIEKNKTILKQIPFGTRTNRDKPFKNYYEWYNNSLGVEVTDSSPQGIDNSIEMGKGLIKNVLDTIKKNSKPMTLEEYEEEEDQKAAKEFKRKKKISEKEDLTRFNRTIKEIEYFFNTEKGSYKNSRSIKSGKDLKEIYNNVLLRLKNSKKSKEFTIPESVELKIKKKLKSEPMKKEEPKRTNKAKRGEALAKKLGVFDFLENQRKSMK